jgi:ComEC/Rec2-related protein
MSAEVFRRTPLLRLLLFFAGGIVLGRELCLPLPADWLLPACAAGFLLASLSFRRRAVRRYYPVALLFTAFLLMGMDLGRDRTVPGIPDGYITARVCSDCLPSGPGGRITADRIRLLDGDCWIRVRGKASLYLEGGKSREVAEPEIINGGSTLHREACPGDLQPGSLIYARCSLLPYAAPLNPAQFDYGAFQRGRGILYQAYLDDASWRTADSAYCPSVQPGPVIRAIRLRSKLMKKLERRISGEAERDILNALLLGYRDDMDPLIEQNFVRSGTLHVLAVSGLHVGILYLLPSLLLKRMRRWPSLRIATGILVFGGLWGYAFLTGLSSSVVRAVSMCCIHGAAGSGRRRADPMHGITLAAFFMILARPAAVFEAGFQLSFAAIAGIFLMYNRLQVLFPFPGVPGRWLSRLLSLSLAAQLSTLPLMIYHFHQAAPASFLASPVVIPLVTMILYAGTLFFLVGGWECAEGALASLLGRLSGLLDAFTHAVAGLPAAWVGGLSLIPLQVILLYLSGILVLVFLERRTARNILLFFSALVLLLTVTAIREIRILTRHRICVFALKRETAVLFMEGRHAALFRGFDPGTDRGPGTDTGPGTDPDPDPALPFGTEGCFHRYRLHPPWQFRAMDHQGSESLPNPGSLHPPNLFYRTLHSPGMEAVYIDFHGKRMLVLGRFDPRYCTGLPILEADVLVLCGNPAINLSQIRDLFRVSRIVADGSNRSGYVAGMANACREAGIPFHATSTSGCFWH